VLHSVAGCSAAGVGGWRVMFSCSAIEDYVFCVDLRTNSDYFPIRRQLTDLDN
jgi:hypothetical protein